MCCAICEGLRCVGLRAAGRRRAKHPGSFGRTRGADGGVRRAEMSSKKAPRRSSHQQGESLAAGPSRSREISMRTAICCALLIAGVMLFQFTARPAADDGQTPAAAADADTLTEITV